MFLPLDVWVAAGVVASHVLLYLLNHVMDQDPGNMSYETAFRNRCGYQTFLSLIFVLALCSSSNPLLCFLENHKTHISSRQQKQGRRNKGEEKEKNNQKRGSKRKGNRIKEMPVYPLAHIFFIPPSSG